MELFIDKDQTAWSNISKECSNDIQSPINIRYNDLVFNDSLKIEFLNYDRPSSSYRVTNHGRSGMNDEFVSAIIIMNIFYLKVQFDYIGDSILVPTITGSALNSKEFVLEQFHFHWGLESKFGSEHRINDHIYPIEVMKFFFQFSITFY